MSSVAYALISLAILYVIGWYIRNERAGADSKGDLGILAMSERRVVPKKKFRLSEDTLEESGSGSPDDSSHTES